MHLTKENINDELGEISQELQSLKNLIKARSGSNNNQTMVVMVEELKQEK